MKLTNEFIEVLRNFSSINSNIVFEVDKPVRVISEAKNILASGPMPDFSYEKDFGIYDLQEFLSAVSLFDSPSFEFDEEYNYVKIVEDKKSIKYFFSNPEYLTYPTKDIKMPSCDVSFTLRDKDINDLKKAASVLSVSEFVVEKQGEEVKAYVTDIKDKTSNSFVIELNHFKCEEDVPFTFVANISDLKLLSGDYDVEYSSKYISRFVGKTNGVEYFIGLDNKESNYGNN